MPPPLVVASIIILLFIRHNNHRKMYYTLNKLTNYHLNEQSMTVLSRAGRNSQQSVPVGLPISIPGTHGDNNTCKTHTNWTTGNSFTRINCLCTVHYQNHNTLSTTVARASAGFWFKGVNAFLPPETKKILLQNGAF